MSDSPPSTLPRFQTYEVPFDSSAPYDGIIALLSRLVAQNPEDGGLIATSSSSLLDDNPAYSPKNALGIGIPDPDCFEAPLTASFRSQSASPNQWLAYNFLHTTVRVDSYSFRTTVPIVEWTLEGADSPDGPWRELDRRKGPTQGYTRQVGIRPTSHTGDAFRVVRLRQTAKNAEGTHELTLFRFELSGGLSAKSDGIIRALTERYGGRNLDDVGAVRVTASSQFRDRAFDDQEYAPKNVLDLDANTRFISVSLPRQWLALEFTNAVVRPSHYAIRSHWTPTGWNHPRSWVLEVSIDGLEWVEVDRQVNNGELNGPSVIAIWPLRVPYDVQWVRITQVDKNHKPDDPEWCDLFEFSALEIYGTIRDF